MKMKYFILILSTYSQAHPAQVLKTPIHLEDNSIKTYLDPISLATNEISVGNSQPPYQYNRSSQPLVYTSPYYSPGASVKRQDYLDYSLAVDSYGVPASQPITAVVEYPEYYGQYYDTPAQAAVEYQQEVTEEPPVYYEYEAPPEEPEPELSQATLLLLLGLCLLFLWPTVLFIEPGAVNNRRRQTTESTTMMAMTTMMPREFYEEQEDSKPCSNVFCHVRQYVTTFGKSFLSLEYS